MMLTSVIKYLSSLCGLIFLISGMAKSLDLAHFTNIIASYQVPLIKWTSPFIVVFEVSVGLFLLFGYRRKQMATISCVILSIFTIVYLYGYIVLGIEDCGCFGKFNILSSSPTLNIIRNILLLIGLIVISKYNPEERSLLERSELVTMILILIVSSFLSGYSFKVPSNKISIKKLHMGKLNEFIQTSSDSTYFVFAFSYTCPHCLNSIANLNQYEKNGVADKVIGLAIRNDAYDKFKEYSTPEFTIIDCSNELLKLTSEFPTGYYIKNNYIQAIVKGELPSAVLFKEMIK